MSLPTSGLRGAHSGGPREGSSERLVIRFWVGWRQVTGSLSADAERPQNAPPKGSDAILVLCITERNVLHSTYSNRGGPLSIASVSGASASGWVSSASRR